MTNATDAKERFKAAIQMEAPLPTTLAIGDEVLDADPGASLNELRDEALDR